MKKLSFIDDYALIFFDTLPKEVKEKILSGVSESEETIIRNIGELIYKKDLNLENRKILCLIISNIAKKEAYDVLISVYRDDKESVELRARAGQSLSFLNQVGDSGEIKDIISSSVDEDVKLAGIYALRYFREIPNSYFILEFVINSNDELSKIIGLESLAYIRLGSDDIILKLVRFFDDSSDIIKIFCVRCLGMIAKKRNLNIIKSLKKNPNFLFECNAENGDFYSELNRAIETIKG